jgi:HD-GYP domain-containing protein (c-di-GMP phosphodiesterase class II)
VAQLAEAAGRRMGLPAGDLLALRHAGYTHDLGELSVPVATWMKATPFSARDVDAVKLHPYHGERALATLGTDGGSVASLVLCHHERLDGSGYHRGVRGSDLSPAARVLAAAEAFQTAREARPHRPAFTDAQAAAKLRADVRDGHLDADAVSAVLAEVGQSSRRETAPRPAGLTPREFDVLRLIAAGLTAKEAARDLGISPKTADNHIQNLYSKIGVTSRAGAALYALERGLVKKTDLPG